MQRHLTKRQLPSNPTMLALLTQPYAMGRDYLRYYQDAAVRSAAEKIKIAAHALQAWRRNEVPHV